jgi:hypothetical protein
LLIFLFNITPYIKSKIQTHTDNPQVPEEERPAYVKGQHLRGVDADNAERCRAEIVRPAFLLAADAKPLHAHPLLLKKTNQHVNLAHASPTDTL